MKLTIVLAFVLIAIIISQTSTFVAYAQLSNNKTSSSAAIAPPQSSTAAKLIVIQNVINHGSGKKSASDFNIMVIGNSPLPHSFLGSFSGKTVMLHAGAYKVVENISSGYIPRYSTDCDSTIRAGQTKTCLVTSEGIMRPLKKVVTSITGPFSGPEALAADSVNGNVYVDNYGDYNKVGTVSVINGSRNVVSSNVLVDNNPTAVAYDYYNNNIYVANLFSNTVSDIDASTNRVLSSVPVYGIHPTGLGYDPANNNIYVTNLDSKSFSVIDTSTNFVIPNIPVAGNPQAVTYDYANGDTYIAMRVWGPNNETNGSVSIIDPKNN